MDKYIKVWGLEKQGKRWLGQLSTSRQEKWSVAVEKAKEEGKQISKTKGGEECVYVDSRWGKWCPFVGQAANKAQQVLDIAGDVKEDGSFYKPVTIKVSRDDMDYTNESYKRKDGEMVWNNPKITVFRFEIVEQSGNSAPAPTPPADVDDSEFPF